MDCSQALTAAVTAAAIAISEGRGSEEIELIAAIFVQLGDSLVTIASGRALLEERNPCGQDQTAPAI